MHATHFKEAAIEMCAFAFLGNGSSAEPARAPGDGKFAVEEQVLQFLQLGLLVIGEADHDPAVFDPVADRVVKPERRKIGDFGDAVHATLGSFPKPSLMPDDTVGGLFRSFKNRSCVIERTEVGARFNNLSAGGRDSVHVGCP